MRDRAAPVTILEHDNVDMAGRPQLTGWWRRRAEKRRHADAGAGGTTRLAALLERDQLRAEQKAGRVFAGWEEGRIGFPPTYKFVAGSDAYAMTSLVDDGSLSRERKKRTPAWCDRILWRGEGVEQRWYARGESCFSDHRPVAASLLRAPGRRDYDGQSARWGLADETTTTTTFSLEL
ncbi:Type I inositol polyphosphate 5-phosphatase 8 [Zea mays]|uniref:Type I inositol polyphosphate 5-phosphatase 8 n=1 Tax=Zea mays TaxID=4577 RepID=A0A3L6EA43_MAIZE|nr:Type I inositol polyphosphate 5-phosphatase 8 [Zea mays]